MYRVRFVKNVWDGESEESSKEFTIFKKDIELNFPPVPGVKFHFGWRAAECPVDITWLCDEQEFRCNMPEEFEHWKFDSHMNYEYNKQSLIDEGWSFAVKMEA
jgi:hypothetical protein